MGKVTWQARSTSSPVVVFTSSQMSGLANDARVLSTGIDNSTQAERWMDLQLTADTTAVSTAGGFVSAHLLRQVSGGTYENGDTSTDPGPNTFVGSFLFTSAATQEIHIIPSIGLPPVDFKILLKNELGIKISTAAGNHCKAIIYTETVAT